VLKIGGAAVTCGGCSHPHVSSAALAHAFPQSNHVFCKRCSSSCLLSLLLKHMLRYLVFCLLRYSVHIKHLQRVKACVCSPLYHFLKRSTVFQLSHAQAAPQGMKDGWFTEYSTMWPGMGMSLKVMAKPSASDKRVPMSLKKYIPVGFLPGSYRGMGCCAMGSLCLMVSQARVLCGVRPLACRSRKSCTRRVLTFRTCALSARPRLATCFCWTVSGDSVACFFAAVQPAWLPGRTA
jgi:hypothetical protein